MQKKMLSELKMLVTANSAGVIALFESARGDEDVVSKDKWRAWATSLDCDVDGDARQRVQCGLWVP